MNNKNKIAILIGIIGGIVLVIIPFIAKYIKYYV